MVLNFVYRWIIHLHWFYYFVRVARIKILNQFQFVELIDMVSFLSEAKRNHLKPYHFYQLLP